MAALGDKLKEARLKQGLTLKEIAEKTRIQAHFLEALEENRLDVIPGAFFRKSFLRQYAEFLGLNPADFDEQSKIQFGSYGGSEEAASAAPLVHPPLDLPPLPTPGKSRDFPLRQVILSIGLLIGVIAVCAVAYTFWEDFQNAKSSRGNGATLARETAPPPTAPNFPASTDQSSEETQQALPPAAEEIAQSAAAPQSQASLEDGPLPAPNAQASGSSPESVSAETRSAPASTVHGAGDRELLLSAKSLTWVRVREGERTLFIGTIDEGQTRLVKVSQGAQILTGNAGGLRVSWQGKDLGNIGPLGQIRTVIVSPTETSIQAPAPKTPSSTAGTEESQGL